MTLRLKFFAVLRERVGRGELSGNFADGASVGEIWQLLQQEYPGLQGQGEALSFAVNCEYVGADFCPREGDELAFIPPVSGGAPVAAARIVRQTIDVAALESAVADPAAGAIVSFVGTTRDNSADRRVVGLEYEAYEPMALREMEKLVAQAYSRFGLVRAAVIHRIGRLEIGEASVAIAVAAAHRAQAFEACRFLIDRIKESVPIWKKEFFEGGEVWVGCQTSHPPHDAH
ncbi:MAG TPA: molybdenum cofactor biosynthesis protein MoaE [Candidatus Binataceae bacterium]|nr:molybdenum cofactor biosynthesis protein MoaE [Candidatus Binataceae bacterium]